MRQSPRYRIFLGLLGPLLIPVLLTAQEPARSLDPSLILEQFDVLSDGDQLDVPVFLGRERYRFAVDTGSAVTVFDESLRRHLGEMESVAIAHGVDGVAVLDEFPWPEANLGRLSLKGGGLVACHDLGPLSQAIGREIHGIIGMDFLRRHIVHLDSDAGRLSFLKAAPTDPGTPVLITYRDEIPSIELDLPGLGSRSFLVDTGMNCTGALGTDDFHALLVRGTAREIRRVLSRDISGDHANRALVVGGVEVRRIRNEELKFDERTGSAGNLLGLGFWERYNVTFDFPNHLIYLKPARKREDPDPIDLSGLHLLRVGGRVVIECVDEDSPAAKSGLRARDVALKIDGQDAAALRLQVLRRRLCEAGRTVRVAVRRGDEVLEFTLTLPDRAPGRNPAVPVGLRTAPGAAHRGIFPRRGIPIPPSPFRDGGGE